MNYVLSSCRRCDMAMSDYVHVLYANREPHYKAVNALYGLVLHRPELRPHMHRSRAALAGWNKVRPRKSYPPISRTVLNALVFVMATMGATDMALATLLTWECYMRASELLALRPKDVLYKGDKRMPLTEVTGGVLIRSSKTGANHFVAVRLPAVMVMLSRQAKLARGAKQKKIFAFSAERWRKTLQAAARFLKLEPHYVLHSLRHGGALTDFLEGVPLLRIKLRGRWKSDQSLKTYLQAGRAILMEIRLPKRVRVLGSLCKGDPLKLMLVAQAMSSYHSA